MVREVDDRGGSTMKKYEMTDIRSGNLRPNQSVARHTTIQCSGRRFGRLDETENNLSQDGDCWVGVMHGSPAMHGSRTMRRSRAVHGSRAVRRSTAMHGSEAMPGSMTMHGSEAMHGSRTMRTWAAMQSLAGTFVCKSVRSSILHRDYLAVGPIGSRNDYTTFYRTASDIWVRCGCFKRFNQ